MSKAVADHDKSFFGHPRGLSVLFMTEMWERFSYYGMRALLILFMTASVASGGLGFDTSKAASIYGWYTSLVYFACIFGGLIADRWLGQRYSVLWGGVIIASGHICLAIPSLTTFYLGLGLIVIGTGLLKTNISVLVGGLYSANDARRDAGFSVFYMGINIGAFISPLITGYLRQNINWHYGFGAAAVGMIFGVVQYVYGWKHLGNIGLKPTNQGKSKSDSVLPSLTAVEIKRLGAIFILFFFSSLFWGAYEQAGSSLNLFADQFTNNQIFGYHFPPEWHQSTPAIMVILLAPLLAWLWIRLGKREPSSPTKFALGLLFVGLGFLGMGIAAHLSGPEKQLVSPNWLTLCYFLHTVGELCLSPVGLSAMTKLAPARYISLMMGVWFLSLSIGNKLGGWVAGFFDTFPLPQLFGAVFLTTTASALLAFALVKPIRKLMSGVH